MYNLRQSQALFFDRWQRDRPASLGRSDVCEVDSLAVFLRPMFRCAPGWAKPVFRNTFVGLAPDLSRPNLEAWQFGPAIISIYPQMSFFVDASVGFYCSLMEAVEANGKLYKIDASAEIFGEPAWRAVMQWIHLLVDLQAVTETQSFSRLPRLVDRIERLHVASSARIRSIRAQALPLCVRTMVGHEYSHLLLGHLSSTSTAANAHQVVRRIDPTIANKELSCDILGAHLALVLTARMFNNVKRRATHLVGGAQSLLIIFLAIEAVGSQTVYGSVLNSDGYPSPRIRFAECFKYVESVASQTVGWVSGVSNPANPVDRRRGAMIARLDTIQFWSAVMFDMVDVAMEEVRSGG